MSQEDDAQKSWDLLVPFTVTHSHGGPFDDQAFTAGWEMGQLWQRCALMDAMEVPAIMATIRRENRPQADLIAMHYGMHLGEIAENDGSPIRDDEWMPVLISIEEPPA